MNFDNIVIAIDFDGSCVTHDFPDVGKDIGAADVLKKLVDNDHQLILYTMRSGKTLEDAVKWFKENDIPLYSIQTNPTQKAWTSSPKCLAQLYIDDAALGCPLKMDETLSDRPFIDWIKVEEILTKQGLIKNN